MRKRGRNVQLYWGLLLVLVVVIGWFVFQAPSLTGYVIYVPETISENISANISKSSALEVIDSKAIVDSVQVWGFDTTTGLTYNASLLILSEGAIQLVPVVSEHTSTVYQTNETNLVQALEYEDDKNQKDRTEKVSTIGQGHVELADHETVVVITFAERLRSGDILSLYVKSGSTSNGSVFVCRNESGCASGEFGSLALPVSTNDDGWFNITLSSINTHNFSLDSPAKIKIDAIKAYRKATIETTTTTTSYPFTAQVETSDIAPASLTSWGTFADAIELNGQQVDYFYSTNSAESWIVMPGNKNLSNVSSSTLRLRASFISNGSATPLLDEMKISYVTSTCDENWTLYYDSCQINDQQLKYYLDSNSCKTKANLPVDNGTAVSCDYCVPSWQQINSSCQKNDTFVSSYIDSNDCYARTGLASDNLPLANASVVSCDYCIPNWQQVNSSCRADDTLSSSFADDNRCYDATRLPSDNDPAPASVYSCNYCATHNCTASFRTEIPFGESGENSRIDARNKTDMILEFSQIFDNTTVAILEYNISDEVFPLGAAGGTKVIDINASALVMGISIAMYYTDEEIQVASLDENTLQIHYYNETYNQTSGQWQALNSTVNATGNYVLVHVPHLSKYGLFGQAAGNSNTDVASASSSGGGGGGGGRIKPRAEALESSDAVSVSQAATPLLSANSEPLLQDALTADTACNYVIEMMLPQEISLVKDGVYEGELVNRGNCDIDLLRLEVGEDLRDHVEISMASLDPIRVGNKTTFLLIRHSTQENWLSSLTGYATGGFSGVANVQGEITLEGIVEEQQVFIETLPVKIALRTGFYALNPVVNVIGFVTPISLVLLLIFLFVRQKSYKQPIAPLRDGQRRHTLGSQRKNRLR